MGVDGGEGVVSAGAGAISTGVGGGTGIVTVSMGAAERTGATVEVTVTDTGSVVNVSFGAGGAWSVRIPAMTTKTRRRAAANTATARWRRRGVGSAVGSRSSSTSETTEDVLDGRTGRASSSAGIAGNAGA